MANVIELSKNYVPLLDQVYKKASLTTVLNTNDAMARAGARANEIIIPKIKMDGLADYSRNSGYVKGDVNLTWETVKFNYDRGRKFEVDYLDNEETAEVAFGMLAAEFQRTKVAPEADAFTFATLAGKEGISKVSTPAVLESGEDVMKALIEATTVMDDDEVPEENRYLFITPTLYNAIKGLDTTKSREILEAFTQIIKVPQSRFYTAIELLDGTSENELEGGYKKANGAADINFMIVHKSAVLKFDKHIASDIITPQANQSSDAYMQKYRKYGLVDVYENKLAGIYLHHKPVV
ncbi:hypothetical protein DFR55_10975 [Herbinix hemicellulosilytica]|uniref:Uncharacterized protein n=1 Tax=Herbinix hemicellulosilytica TaxID=1564487 RepID=A0A0H5SX56_HERHM|nr:hypothetical protein [Herbinix hemicellulosilytica]RBP58860.1 hypothetical protein DFR55_10975 [Herbinix hemicellulosilytica]CRZ34933.1 hypothetical protein HHT355_1733 [Herbinix hemicellulosilytica]